MQWNWITLAGEVERAHRALVSRGEPGHAEAAERFRDALAAAWPPGFFDQLERCKRGDPRALDDILDFVEASPRFFGSGYVMDKAVRWLARPPRSEVQIQRMRAIVLNAVGRRLRIPTRRVAALARAVDSPSLRSKLTALANGDNSAVRATARVVLAALPGPPAEPERARERRVDDRIRSMVVTAHRMKSPKLLRRVLALDPRGLSSVARSYLAALFELAMNLNLIPDEELLPIARRLDGPEMEPIWRWALNRRDHVGDRARALLARVRQTHKE